MKGRYREREFLLAGRAGGSGGRIKDADVRVNRTGIVQEDGCDQKANFECCCKVKLVRCDS